MRGELGFYIKRMSNLLERLSYQHYHNSGRREFSLMNHWVVDYLYNNRHRDVYPRDIEEEFLITRATVSKMLNLMEKKELIVRENTPEDGRMKKIRLLPAGVQLRKDAMVIRDQIEEQLRSNLSPEEQDMFLELCRKLLQGMN